MGNNLIHHGRGGDIPPHPAYTSKKKFILLNNYWLKGETREHKDSHFRRQITGIKIASGIVSQAQ